MPSGTVVLPHVTPVWRMGGPSLIAVDVLFPIPLVVGHERRRPTGQSQPFALLYMVFVIIHTASDVLIPSSWILLLHLHGSFSGGDIITWCLWKGSRDT